MANKKKQIKKPPSARELLKMEIAREMGILEQVEKDGWQSISNATCGRLGGIMRQRLKQLNEQE